MNLSNKFHIYQDYFPQSLLFFTNFKRKNRLWKIDFSSEKWIILTVVMLHFCKWQSIYSLSHSPYEFPIPRAINFPAVWSLFSKVHVQIAHFSSLPLRKVALLIGQKAKKWKHYTKISYLVVPWGYLLILLTY